MGVVLLGFLIGMRHALEADHVAAVASLAGEGRSFRSVVRQGVVWGFGHTVTLLAVGAVAVGLGQTVPERLAALLEAAVGAMLIVLGFDVLRRLIKDRVHIHYHQHEDGTEHLHAHSHRGDAVVRHDPERHRHRHPEGFPLRALAIGLMHGMAGSAALLVLTAATFDSVLVALVYILLFGLGSLVGMALLSAVISIPLRLAARSLTHLHHTIHGVVGCLTIALGVVILVRFAA